MVFQTREVRKNTNIRLKRGYFVMVREQAKIQSRIQTRVEPKRQFKDKPRTIEERARIRDMYVFSKTHGTLKCKGKPFEITSASFGAMKPGDKVKVYTSPFSEIQAREICNAFKHDFLLR